MLLGFLVLPMLIAKTAYEVAVEDWKAQNPAYPVKNEYIASNFLGAARILIIQSSIPFKNTIDHVFSAILNRLYDSAISKIPETDGERVIWYNLVYIAPRIAQNNALSSADSTILMKEMLQKVEELNSLPIKNEYIRTVVKLDAIERYSAYFLKEQARLEFSNDEKYHIKYRLVHVISQQLPNINLSKFIDNKNESERISPVRLGGVGFLLGDQLMDSPAFACQSGLISDMQQIILFIERTKPLYTNSVILSEQSQILFNKMMKYIDYKTPILKEHLLRRCHYDLVGS